VTRDHAALRFFEAIARRYDRDYALSGSLSRERLARIVELVRGKERVLVLGSGTGRELPALLDAGHHVEAIEISPAMIALANQRARRIPIHEGDFYEPLPFPDGSFAAVLALHGTLAHPPAEGAHAALATEIVRVLERAGVFVAEVPAAVGLRDGSATLEVTGPTTFTHHDERAEIAYSGIALDAEGWKNAFPSLAIDVSPLGAVEYLLVGRPA